MCIYIYIVIYVYIYIHIYIYIKYEISYAYINYIIYYNIYYISQVAAFDPELPLSQRLWQSHLHGVHRDFRGSEADHP